ncbi:hypothetical protein B484DRAFT_64057 [Ochromonadaceae sp. CCMP2298]|nr:hypothetical protein B484DRAFT_64057 [Ochromonadaceae sp. CCMP2298]
MHPLRASRPLALIFILLAELLHDSSSFFVPAHPTRRMFAERPFRPPPRLPLAVYSAGGSGDLSLAKLDFSECYYEVLECDRDCDAKELKKAYYRMVSKFHPDSRPESEKDLANRQMMVVNGAYSVLRGERRGEYDKQRRKGLKGAAAGVKASGRNTESEDTESSDTDSSSGSSSRESTGTKSSANEAYSAYSYGADARARGDSWRSRPTGGHFDSNGGFSSTPYESSRQRDRARSESTRPSGRGDGSLSSLRAQLASLQLYRRRKQQLLAGDKRDWGDVVDPDLIRKRLGDLQELRDLEAQLSEVEDEIESIAYNGRSSDGGDNSWWVPSPEPQGQPQTGTDPYPQWDEDEDWAGEADVPDPRRDGPRRPGERRGRYGR